MQIDFFHIYPVDRVGFVGTQSGNPPWNEADFIIASANIPTASLAFAREGIALVKDCGERVAQSKRSRPAAISRSQFSGLDCMAITLPCLACRLFLGMTATAP